MYRKLLKGVALAALIAGTTVTGAAIPTSAAHAAGSVTVTYKDDVSTLDPAIGYDWQNWSMIKSLFDGLMDYKRAPRNWSLIWLRTTACPTTG